MRISLYRSGNSYPLFEFLHNSHLIRQIKQKKFRIKLETRPGIEPRSIAEQSGTLTITPNCFLSLCETAIQSYACMGDSVKFV